MYIIIIISSLIASIIGIVIGKILFQKNKNAEVITQTQLIPAPVVQPPVPSTTL